MRLQIAILSLLLLAGCSEWDKHRPRLAEPPVAVKGESVFTKLCDSIIEKYQHGSPSTDATFTMLQQMTGSDDCELVVKRILAMKHLDLSNDTSTRYTLDLDLISKMENLETLILRQHLVDSVAPLANMPNLAVLDVSETSLESNLETLGLASLPLNRYRRLRFTVESQAAADSGVAAHIGRQLRKSLSQNEILVRALVDRGTKIVPITLDADATKRAAEVKAWQEGRLFPPRKDLELGTFIHSEQVSEVNPNVVLDRGYTLDFTIIDDVRDADHARTHLLEEFAETGKGNTWTYPVSEIESYFQVLIQPTVPIDTPTGRSGAVPAQTPAPQEAK